MVNFHASVSMGNFIRRPENMQAFEINVFDLLKGIEKVWFN